MIEFYTGVPGSGKTYRAVSYLYDIFLDSKSKSFGKFEKFYTNINEFKFDQFPRGVAYDLDFEELLIKLTQLHKLYMTKCTDSELMELCSALDLAHSFFVIDEAHNYFEKKNSVLVWWLSYHRHLHQDIILITQNLALVESKYKSFSEFFYKAVPSSLRVFGNSLRYEQFIGSRMFKSQRSEKYSLKFNPLVYDLYASGANTQGKKVIYKYLAFALIAITALLVMGYFIFHVMFGSSNKVKGANSSTPLTPSPVVVKPPVDSQNPVLRFVCNFDECQHDSYIFDNHSMLGIIDKYKFDVISMQDLHNGFFIYTYRTPAKFSNEVLND